MRMPTVREVESRLEPATADPFVESLPSVLPNPPAAWNVCAGRKRPIRRVPAVPGSPPSPRRQ